MVSFYHTLKLQFLKKCLFSIFIDREKLTTDSNFYIVNIVITFSVFLSTNRLKEIVVRDFGMQKLNCFFFSLLIMTSKFMFIYK
jgi:hypothetical protein